MTATSPEARKPGGSGRGGEAEIQNGVQNGVEAHLPIGFGLKRALLALLAAALLPAGGLAIGQAVNDYSESRRLRAEAYVARLAAYVDEEDALLAATRGVLDFAASEVPEVMNDRTACNALMDRVKRSRARFHSAHFSNEEGYVVCGSGDFDKPIYIGDRVSNTDPSTRLRPRVDVIFGRSSQRRVVVVLEPVFDGETMLGTLSVSIDVASFDRLAKLTDEDTSARVALFSHRATDSRPFAEDVGQDADWLPERPDLAALAQDAPAVRALTARSGAQYVYASADMAERELVAVAGWPMESVDFDLKARTALSVALPILTWALASLIAYIAVDRLVLIHVRRLTRLTGALRRGDLGARAELPANAPREFVELGEQFDRMAHRIEEREERLRRAVEHERMLLREVYHRVKNNLQLIVSLLNLQARQARSDEALSVIRQTQDRVQSLAMVHQNLYQLGRLSEARLDIILEQVVAATQTMGGDANVGRGEGGIETITELEPVRIGADRAVAASLLATEALINVFKHAWTPGRRGRLRLTLKPVGDGGFDLTIANDLPKERLAAPAEGNGRGIGESLMRGFARQLRGELTQRVEGEWFVVHIHAPEPPAPSEDADTDADGDEAASESAAEAVSEIASRIAPRNDPSRP